MAEFFWNISKAQQDKVNPGRHRIQSPANTDISELNAANEDLLIGLYEGTYPGLKLASALAYPIVFVPVSFMGMPTPSSDDPKTQALLTEIMEDAQQPLNRVFTRRAIVGTAWAWPNWDAKNQQIVHEIIPDKTVVTIEKNIDTGEVIRITTDEQMTVQLENRTGSIRRKRAFTQQSVITTYIGDTRGLIVDKKARNPSGIMPIPFAVNVLDNSVRGSGYYARLLADFKVYHDIDLKWSQTLTKFNVKMIQSTTKVDDWLKNNGYNSLDEIDVETMDIIFNINGQESTTFEFPTSFSDAFAKRLETTFHKIVEGSPIPELSFGLMAAGNHASVETDMTALGRAVQNDRNQINDPITEYISACLRLKMGATMESSDPEFTMGWNDLQVLSEETKMKLFEMFAIAVDKLMARAAITLEQLHKMFLAAFPKSTEVDFATWFTQMNLAAKYKQFAEASYVDALDAAGIDLPAGL